jgi:hypothetical protein
VQAFKKKNCYLEARLYKAFDTLEHSTILLMMERLGFIERWLRWTREILKSPSTSILLIGVPGKSLPCKRGVRQGDPMSPLLFVLAVELL